MARPPRSSPAATNGRPYHKGNVAEDLRKAAERILATERLEDVTLRRLVREVGVAPNNFYNHYQSVEELLFSIAAAGFSENTERASVILAKPGSKADLLVEVAIDLVCFSVRNRELARAMFRKPENEYPEYQAAGQRAMALLVRFLYGEDYHPVPPVAMSQQFGVAVGYFALWYGLARVALDGFFDLDADDDEELARFVENSVRPIVDSLLASGTTNSAIRGAPTPTGSEAEPRLDPVAPPE